RGVARRAPAGVVEVEDIDGGMIEWFRKAGFSDNAVAVVRPDKFTFAVVARKKLPATIGVLRAQLG
ncbi:3-(3-hydroxyphenyl)propionate hydroxylase, partial [Acinetobacter baumannii]